ncbi:SGNH/GDSL hydrolase family protein [Bailinhaonella thermotolerans]|uniref:SGNH/GDSL hydrolase family protein n=1 Tax=Bailinhaonella thermotolerans TaxID=1070861 RepID=A0A3A3ZZK0_9ACTN|nr:SGNH/GDSL hydrolase family protein [Bailinhaonella thermotolerans]RJL19510.1 SGNH/GDSL hydrolase family protein [Bailinhaonella thermotolerans]
MPADSPSPARRAPRPLRRLLSAIAAAAVAGTALAAGAPAAHAASPGPYVALGDSYTAGTGIPVETDANCGRSDRNYPTLTAAALAPASFTDASCSGATTAHMTTSQGTAPPQFDALTPDTRLVTVGIGGNDIDFVGIIGRCVILGKVNPFGAPCKASYTWSGTDQLAQRIDGVAPRIDAVLQGIRDRAPDARILLVGYPVILPDDGTNCHSIVPIAKGDAPWLRDTEKRLNAMLAARAAAHGAVFVDTYTGSVGHDLCKPRGTRWVEPMNDIDSAGFHPNAAGHEAMARAVTAAAAQP